MKKTILSYKTKIGFVACYDDFYLIVSNNERKKLFYFKNILLKTIHF